MLTARRIDRVIGESATEVTQTMSASMADKNPVYGLLPTTSGTRRFQPHCLSRKGDRLVDAFVSSCFVHVNKPDTDIFRLALDIAQVPARQVLYVENSPLFVEIAKGLGTRTILHIDYRSTCKEPASLGLNTGEGGSREAR